MAIGIALCGVGCTDDSSSSAIGSSTGSNLRARFLVIRESRQGLVDGKGREILPPEFVWVTWDEDRNIVLSYRDRTYVVFDLDGNKMGELSGVDFAKLSDGWITFRDEEGLWGVMDRTEVVLPATLKSETIWVSQPYVFMLIEGRVGIITIDGEVVVPARFMRLLRGEHNFIGGSENGIEIFDHRGTTIKVIHDFRLG